MEVFKYNVKQKHVLAFTVFPLSELSL